MDCPHCHSVLPQGAVYCPHCGAAQLISSHPSNQIKPSSVSSVLSATDPALMRQPQSAPNEVLTLERPDHEMAEQLTEHEEQPTEYAEQPTEHEEDKEEDNNERLMVFSDGIIAFALTVAAITIKIPASAEELSATSDSIVLRCVMYVLAFIIVVSAWADHHAIFHYIKRNNIALVVINFFYLAAIVMFPIGLFFVEFGLELSDASPTTSTQQIVLGLGIFLGSQMVAGLTLSALWIYSKHGSRLLEDGLDPRFSFYMTQRLLSKPLTFAFVVIMLYLDDVMIHSFIILLVVAVALIAREIYFWRARRGIDLTVGTDDTQRIQLFSDAVIGIAITLAVAQIEFPTIGDDNKSALEAINHQWPLLHAFLVGIVIIGVYWLFHYHLFRLIKRHDTWLIFLNNFFLLDIALMLIPVNWFVNYYAQPDMDAHLVFGIWQILTSLVLVVMWRHVSHKKRLIRQDATPQQIRQVSIIIIANPLIFLLLTIFSSFVSGLEPSLYIGIYLAMIGGTWLVSRYINVEKRYLPATK